MFNDYQVDAIIFIDSPNIEAPAKGLATAFHKIFLVSEEPSKMDFSMRHCLRVSLESDESLWDGITQECANLMDDSPLGSRSASHFLRASLDRFKRTAEGDGSFSLGTIRQLNDGIIFEGVRELFLCTTIFGIY